MSVQDTAKKLGVSPSTVLRMVYRQEIEPLDPINPALARHTYRFAESELDRFLAARAAGKRKTKKPGPKPRTR